MTGGIQETEERLFLGFQEGMSPSGDQHRLGMVQVGDLRSWGAIPIVGFGCEPSANRSVNWGADEKWAYEPKRSWFYAD